MNRWETYFEGLYPAVVEAGAVQHPLACAMVELLTSDRYGGAELVCCRGGKADEPRSTLLILNVQVGLGQLPVVHDIRFVEPVAISFGRQDALPAVYPLRDGFPTSVPHLNLAPEGYPRSLCLFEMPEEEAIRIATPLVFFERIRIWLAKTGYSELHGQDQPLDPFFAVGGRTVIVPGFDSFRELSGLFYGFCVSEHPGAPAILEHANQRRWTRTTEKANGMSAVLIATEPLTHAQIRVLPRNVAELLGCFQEIGVDLVAPLRKAFQTWLSDSSLRTLLDQPCLIIVYTPMKRSDGGVVEGSVKGFLTAEPAKQLAEGLGALLTAKGHFSVPIIEVPVSMGMLQGLVISPVDLLHSFDRKLARAASGTSDALDRDARIAAVGVGALGSQLVLSAVRMGIGNWTLIDPDHLLPHNVARHALSAAYVGLAKAEAMSIEIDHIMAKSAAKVVVARVDGDPACAAALADVDVVLDMSASVPVARWLATASNHVARTASVFFNPPGTDLVILREGDQRSPRLDHVEMSYYWLLVTNRALDGHFVSTGAGLYPSGGCRQPSLRLPQARVGMLAELAANQLFLEPQSEHGEIEIWRKSDVGLVAVRATASTFQDAECGDWTISISSEVICGIECARQATGNLETGGILIGSWDKVRKRAYVVGHYDPPPDSISASTGFVRGSVGVYRTIEAVEASTATNLTYVGEWHTHPPLYSGRPSVDDGVLLRWIDDVLLYAGVPPIMLIAADDGLRVILKVGTEQQMVVAHLGSDRGPQVYP